MFLWPDHLQGGCYHHEHPQSFPGTWPQITLMAGSSDRQREISEWQASCLSLLVSPKVSKLGEGAPESLGVGSWFIPRPGLRLFKPKRTNSKARRPDNNGRKPVGLGERQGVLMESVENGRTYRQPSPCSSKCGLPDLLSQKYEFQMLTTD